MREFASDMAAFQEGHRFEQISIKGISFRYLLCGEGKTTLTLLTGGMGLAELNFAFIEKLEEHYRVLTFDYPMGLDTNAALADAVRALLGALGIKRRSSSENLSADIWRRSSHGDTRTLPRGCACFQRRV